MGNPAHNPLARPADLASYRWPTRDERNLRSIYARAAARNATIACRAQAGSGGHAS